MKEKWNAFWDWMEEGQKLVAIIQIIQGAAIACLAAATLLTISKVIAL